jgi:hypothetical protein
MLRSVALMISLTLSTAAIAEQYSIRCERDAWLHYVTFDTASNRAIYENANGTPQKGQIISSSTGGIVFDLLQVGGPKYDLVWRPADGTLTVLGLSENSARPTIVMKCSKTDLRPILPYYDGIAPVK